jgi:KDO2-lipid IV(A) lauroyltransferase
MFRKRKVAENNLRMALSNHLSPDEIRSLTKKVFQNLVCNFIDLLCLPKIKSQGFDTVVTLEGKENLEKAMAGKKGCILLAMHSGSWELASLVGSMCNYPYSVVANEQIKTPQLNELLNEYRRLAGAKIIPPGSATREIIRALQSNEIVSLVLDQGGKDGIPVDFFGKTASMSTGAIRLGLKYQTPLCPVWIERQENGRHRLKVLPALNLQTSDDIERDVFINTQKAVKIFEDLLRGNPSEGLWFYKIYKYSTQADVLILDDHKTGHLRQSQSVVEALKTLLSRRNKQTRLKTVPIVYKGSWSKNMLVVYSFLSQFLFFLRNVQSLKFFLKPECYQALTRNQADYIISCGSQTAPINFLLSSSWLVKSIHILRPGIISWDRFSLITLPEHDKPRGLIGVPVVLTKVALNLITPQYLREQQDRLFLKYSHLKNNVRSKIGVLIGGNTKGVKFESGQIRSLARQLKEAAEHFNMDLLITTSRRTPKDIDQIMVKEFRNFNRCSLLIIPNESNIPEAVGGILALSDIVIVSGESISMVSEALSSGKKTIVFAPNGQYSSHSLSKYEQFVLDLNSQRYLLACDIKDVASTINQVMSQKISVKNLDDKTNLFKSLESIL